MGFSGTDLIHTWAGTATASFWFTKETCSSCLCLPETPACLGSLQDAAHRDYRVQCDVF